MACGWRSLAPRRRTGEIRGCVVIGFTTYSCSSEFFISVPLGLYLWFLRALEFYACPTHPRLYIYLLDNLCRLYSRSLVAYGEGTTSSPYYSLSKRWNWRQRGEFEIGQLIDFV